VTAIGIRCRGHSSLGGIVAGRLPKTRSGKTLRRTVRSLGENAHVGDYDKRVDFPGPTVEVRSGELQVCFALAFILV
jgi:hypothetical protein